MPLPHLYPSEGARGKAGTLSQLAHVSELPVDFAEKFRDEPGTRIRGCSSAGRALQSHCRGQGFESPQLHQFPSQSRFGGTRVGIYAARIGFSPDPRRVVAGSGRTDSREEILHLPAHALGLIGQF